MADTKISALPPASTPLAGTELVPIVQGGITEQVSIANLTAGRAVNALSLATTQGITGGSGFQVSGFTSYRSSGASASSPGDAAIYYNAATGYTLQARAGSSYDWSLISPGNASYIARVPTGTLNLELAGGNLAFSTSGKGIDFSANTHAAGMTSELFNDYEEGTWTPVVTASSGTITTVGTVQGFYTKIGNLVFVWGTVQITNNGTGAGILLVAGLPFTPLATTQSASGCVGSGYNTSSGAMSLVRITGNSTQCQIARYDGLYPIGTGQTIGFSANYYV